MGRLFSLDNPVWNFLGKIVDMLILTVLWLVTSLPIITIGASTTALYYHMLKLAENKEGYLFRSYFKAFKENFKQSTICWLIMLVIGLVLAGDFCICNSLQTPAAKMLMIAFFVFAYVYLMIITYLFPLIARCDTGIKNLFAMAFMMSIKDFGWTLLMIVITVCVFAIGIFVQWLFLFISVGLISYLNSLILKLVFEKYHLGLEDALL